MKNIVKPSNAPQEAPRESWKTPETSVPDFGISERIGDLVPESQYGPEVGRLLNEVRTPNAPPPRIQPVQQPELPVEEIGGAANFAPPVERIPKHTSAQPATAKQAAIEGAALGYGAATLVVPAAIGGAGAAIIATEVGASAGVTTAVSLGVAGGTAALAALPLAVGAGVGYVIDRKNRVRGAAIGSVAGGVGTGLLLGGISTFGVVSTAGILGAGALGGIALKKFGEYATRKRGIPAWPRAHERIIIRSSHGNSLILSSCDHDPLNR